MGNLFMKNIYLGIQMGIFFMRIICMGIPLMEIYPTGILLVGIVFMKIIFNGDGHFLHGNHLYEHPIDGNLLSKNFLSVNYLHGNHVY